MSSDHKLFYHDEGVQSKARSRKLIELEGGKLEVTRDGKKLLSSLEERRPCNLVFVFGNARSGKSFLMNCLFGATGIFKVINSSQPCTRGVDISSLFIPQSTLSEKAGLPAGKREHDPLLGFVDVEGQGAEDGTHDTLLALPLLLTSRVVLFNHKGAPTVNDMLSKLGVMARAAQYVDVNEEGKDGVISTGRKKFGHLHVVFRDFSFSANSDDVYKQLMGKEKVVQSLKAPDAKGPKERNDIRDLLQENFESIQVWLLKQPASADQLLQYSELPEELIDPDFIETIGELRKSIVLQMADPTLFNGSVVTAPRLFSLLTQICQVLNEGGLINVPSVYRAMEKETINRIASNCLAAFEAVIQQLTTALPMSEEKLSSQLNAERNRILTKYNTELTGCLLDVELKEKRAEIEKTIARSIDFIQRDNAELLLHRIREVIAKEMELMRNKFEQYCRGVMPTEKERDIDNKFADLLEQAEKNIANALNSTPEVMKFPEFGALLSEAKKNLVSVFKIKKLENAAMLKDYIISKLRNDTEQKQQRLVDQNKQLESFLEEEKAATADMERRFEELKKEREQEAQRLKEAQQQMEKTKLELARLRQRPRCVFL